MRWKKNNPQNGSNMHKETEMRSNVGSHEIKPFQNTESKVIHSLKETLIKEQRIIK